MKVWSKSTQIAGEPLTLDRVRLESPSAGWASTIGSDEQMYCHLRQGLSCALSGACLIVISTPGVSAGSMPAPATGEFGPAVLLTAGGCGPGLRLSTGGHCVPEMSDRRHCQPGSMQSPIRAAAATGAFQIRPERAPRPRLPGYGGRVWPLGDLVVASLYPEARATPAADGAKTGPKMTRFGAILHARDALGA
jgi:hypothetical protein